MARELWRKGVRFRRNVVDLTGKPDIAIKKYKLVVFVDSCFWHGCPYHFTMPKSNRKYWRSKIERNKKRDKRVNEYYKQLGWNVLRFWEHQINKDVDAVVRKVKTILSRKRLRN